MHTAKIYRFLSTHYTPNILLAGIWLCTWGCRSTPTITEVEQPSSLSAAYDNSYVLTFVQKSDYTYHLQTCLVDVLGSPLEGSCVDALRNKRQKSIAFTANVVFFNQPSNHLKESLKNLARSYDRFRFSKRAPLYQGVGATTGASAAILSLRAIKPLLNKQRPNLSGLWTILALWGSTYLFFKAADTLKEEGKDFSILEEQMEENDDIKSEFIKTYKNLPVLVDSWDTIISEDPSELKEISSVKNVLHDLTHLLIDLKWVDDKSKIHSYCLPSKKPDPSGSYASICTTLAGT